MRTEQIALPFVSPGSSHSLTVHRFGMQGARPRVYLQAALHADEIPGMLVAHHLRARLEALESEGRINGEVILVPSANPLGLAQSFLGNPVGRFHLADGVNFNRNFPYLVPRVADSVRDELGDDGDENVRIIRHALASEVSAWPAPNAISQLKKTLVSLAIEADFVLDMHCDSQAAMHLYTLTPSADALMPLARLLGALAMLVSTESGDDPFDEVFSRPWHELSRLFPDRPIPMACHSTTLEFRGECDVEHDLASEDAAALIDFLVLSGVLSGPVPKLPPARCEPTNLATSEPVTTPVAGIVVYRASPGERVHAGDCIAEVIDPLTGATTELHAQSDGILYARIARRFAQAGQRLAKIAGTTYQHGGKLLSA